MKNAIGQTLLAMALAASATALACADHAPGTEPVPRAAARAPAPKPASGVVREIDLEQRTVALRHGAIRSLRMNPMESMVFKVDAGVSLQGLAVGDKVRFRAVLAGNDPTITQITRSRQ